MTTPEQRLKQLGVTLPSPAKPVANYVGWVQTGKLVFVAGQVPVRDGKISVTGQMGDENNVISLETAATEARQCAINIVAQLNDACEGDLSRIKRIVKLTGFVSCVPGFKDQPKVVNGASDFMVEVFGDAGRHARAAVGVSSLPSNVVVEVDAIVEVT
jgi:enamine deaminase RidA (YjgF/YER057c/UK114 family)